MSTVVTAVPTPTGRFARIRRRHGWLAAVAVLLVVLFVLRATQVPRFGGFEIRTIIAGSLTLAFLAMGQAVVVISGGINMSVGALMVFTNCLCAKYMEGQGVLAGVAVALGVIVLSAAISAVIGWLIALSGVPDIVVTLAASFIIAGGALVVLPGPGGGISASLQPLIVGGFSNPIPAVIWILVGLLAVWLPFRRSRWGVATYAIGSRREAAYLSGVNVTATRIRAYALSGLFVGFAGFVTTAFTGGGEPRSSIGLAALLASVAAVVLGGVSLVGGSGGLVGPVIAALVLTLLAPIMLGLGWNPNYAEVARGVILILVVMLGGLLQITRRRT